MIASVKRGAGPFAASRTTPCSRTNARVSSIGVSGSKLINFCPLSALNFTTSGAGSGSVTVTLSVGEGVLTVTAGTSGALVSNSGTTSVTITGTNLASPTGVTD